MPDLIAIGEPLVGEARPRNRPARAGRPVDNRFRVSGWGGDTANFVLAAARLGTVPVATSRGWGRMRSAPGLRRDAAEDTERRRRSRVKVDADHHTGLYFVDLFGGTAAPLSTTCAAARRRVTISRAALISIRTTLPAPNGRSARERHLPGDLRLVRATRDRNTVAFMELWREEAGTTSSATTPTCGPFSALGDRAQTLRRNFDAAVASRRHRVRERGGCRPPVWRYSARRRPCSSRRIVAERPRLAVARSSARHRVRLSHQRARPESDMPRSGLEGGERQLVDATGAGDAFSAGLRPLRCSREYLCASSPSSSGAVRECGGRAHRIRCREPSRLAASGHAEVTGHGMEAAVARPALTSAVDGRVAACQGVSTARLR